MAHGNPVTDRNRRKFHRKASRFGNAHLHRLTNLIQIDMSRNNFIVGTYHADHRLLHFFLGITQGVK